MADNDPFAAGPEVLSQAEVENLLNQVAASDAQTTVHTVTGEKASHHKDSIQPYDFRNPVFLSAGELRRLRIHHEEFIHSLAARLSIYLRTDFTLQMSKLLTLNFSKFTETLANPTHLTLFKVEPLRGICVLDVAPRLGLTIVDRLLGGPGHSVAAGRDLSEIEIALLDQAIQIIISEWCSQWAPFQDLRHVLLGHESNGQFLQTSGPDTVTLILSMEARMGDCLEQIQIGIPYHTIEPLIAQLGASLQTADPNPAGSAESRLRWNAQFGEVKVPITAEWPAMRLTAGELTRLKPGDVLQVESDVLNQVQVRLADIPKFIGRLGTQGSRWAVEVTHVLKP